MPSISKFKENQKTNALCQRGREHFHFLISTLDKRLTILYNGFMITERQACLTGRQEKLLDFLVKEYISNSEPVSSKALKKATDLDVCGATIRNDLQELTKHGFIKQPYTSGGRIPTKKAYRYFAEKIEAQRQNAFENFIGRQIREAHEEMEREMRQMGELMQTLENDNLFEILNILDKWHQNQI